MFSEVSNFHTSWLSSQYEFYYSDSLLRSDLLNFLNFFCFKLKLFWKLETFLKNWNFFKNLKLFWKIETFLKNWNVFKKLKLFWKFETFLKGHVDWVKYTTYVNKGGEYRKMLLPWGRSQSKIWFYTDLWLANQKPAFLVEE